MPEATDLRVISEYISLFYQNYRVIEVEVTKGYEGVSRLKDHTLTDCWHHGKKLHMKWTKGEGSLYLTVHLMLHGRLYDLNILSGKEKLFTLHMSYGKEGRGLGLFDHMRTAKVWISTEPPQEDGSCVMRGVSKDALDSLLSSYSRRTITSAFLAQKIVLGIGTVMTSEVLHTASIHPLTLCGSLGSEARTRLLDALREVPLLMYQCGSFSHKAPASPDGRDGNYENEVHGKTTCDEMVVMKISTSGRVVYTTLESP